MNMQEKSEILKSGIESTGMKVPMAVQRFPMVDGYQSKVTLRSKTTGTFMNIGFMEGIDNTINGNVADRLMDDFPGQFDIIKINGIDYGKGKQDLKEKRLIDTVISQLKEQYDFVPKKDLKPSNRTRVDEPKSNPKSEVSQKK